MKQRGALIAIEGGEGAGKGTVIATLSERLGDLGFNLLVTREPGGTAEGLALRQLLLGDSGKVWSPWAELLLMTAARVQHVRRVIAPAIERGETVISDRFIGSTIAYQGAGRGIATADIENLHRQAVGEIWPDLTVLLDIDPRVGIRRSLARLQQLDLDEGRFETMDIAFHDRIRDCFLRQAAGRGLHAVVDAGLPAADVAARVEQIVLDWLRRNGIGPDSGEGSR